MRKDLPVTLIDVAKHAGVSKTTASDALSGSGRVSAATRKAVLEAAAALAYVPNAPARHLRRAATGTIGLHLPEVLTRLDYYMSFVFGVVDQAARRDYDVTIISPGQGRAGGRVLRVDGLVLGDPVSGDPTVERLMSAGLPTVTCERFLGKATPNGVVWSEHGSMLGELLDELRRAGAARPALVVSSGESDWAANLAHGYRRWCGEHGLDPVIRTVPFGAAADHVPGVVRSLLGERPELDALVCAPDGSAVQILPVLRELGREVGRDLLLASCVDSTAMRVADPPITAIDLRPREAGASCAELLFELLAGASPDGTSRTHPIELALRASTRHPLG